jgi:hypothetical protein
MGRIILILVVLIAVLAGAGFVYLGAFPPDPPSREVTRTLPNDRFQGR